MRSACSGIGRGMRGILRVYILGLRGLEVGRGCGNAVHRSPSAVP